MGFKRRIGFIVKSQFNDWVTRAEDPEKILNQAVEEMEEGLDTAKQKISLLRYRVEEEEKLLAKLSEQTEYWQKKAEEYITNGMDSNAREAVRKRRILDEEQRVLTLKLDEDKLKYSDYEERYEELERRVRASKSRKTFLLKEISINKGPSLESQGAQTTLPSDKGDAFTVFGKMEERVEEGREFTAASRASKEAQIEKEQRLIDEEIENIKKKISKGGSKK